MKKFILCLLTALLLVCVGIFMISMPDAFLGIVVIIFSLFLIFDGIKSFYTLLKVKVPNARLKWTLGIKALINCAIGIVAIILAIRNPSAISRLLVYLIAFDFFATALVDLFDYIIMRGDALVTGTLGFEIVISLLFGILFCIFPQFISHTAITILAVVVICIGIMTFIIACYSLYFERVLKKHGIDLNNKDSVDVEYTEVDDSTK